MEAAAWSSATDERRLDALERDLRVEADDPADPAAGGGPCTALLYTTPESLQSRQGSFLEHALEPQMELEIFLGECSHRICGFSSI